MKNINYSLEEIIYKKNLHYLLDNLFKNILEFQDPGMPDKNAYIFNSNIIMGHNDNSFIMLYSNKDGWEYCFLTQKEFYSNRFRRILLES